MGVLHRARIDDVVVKRMLSVIINPNRYRSKAAEAFCKEILPKFASYTADLQTYTLGHPEAVQSISLDHGSLVVPDIDS
jgi:hypothetical protein